MIDAITKLLEQSVGSQLLEPGFVEKIQELGKADDDTLAYLSLSNLQKLFKISTEKTEETILQIKEGNDFEPSKTPRLLEQIYKM